MIKDLYIQPRFFFLFGAVIVLFILGFPFPLVFALAQGFLLLALVVVLVDFLLLFGRGQRITCQRESSGVFSLGNENPVVLRVSSGYSIPLQLMIIDELPFQFQKRDFKLRLKLSPEASETLSYRLRPTERGRYRFGRTRIFATSTVGLLQRRFTMANERNVPVYPSIMDMKKYEIKSVMKLSTSYGVKKVRRIGQSSEFEQIKDYVQGDDYQSINWKATGRYSKLMVNHYQDEQSQQVYTLIDKSRYMKMPFDDLTLLDYAINASLVISNTALLKQDKTGLITFSDKVETYLKASKQRSQLKVILEALYKEEECRQEANYELLYKVLQNKIRVRSLIFLYANFESLHALERVLPILRKINRRHLLILVIFRNTELQHYYKARANNLEEIYLKTIAQKFDEEKRQIINELNHYGIQVIYTEPRHLTIDSLNKYLELKSRGMI